MKKYTKRLLAFLLATVMVLSGLPMSAKEVKAADEEVIILDITAPTNGVVSNRTFDQVDGEWIIQDIDPEWYYSIANGGDANADSKADSRSFTITTELKGDNWRFNSGRALPEPTAGKTEYMNYATSSFYYFKWAKTSSTWRKENGLGTYKTVLYLYGNATFAIDFDLTAEQAGEYTVQLVYDDQSTPQPLYFDFNKNTDVAGSLYFTKGEVYNTVTEAVKELLDADDKTNVGAVDLVAGTNTLDICNRNGASNETRLIAIILTKVATTEPTPEPTAEPVPTAEPTAEPAPTAEPTAEPVPTAEPTTEPVPTAEPTAEPVPTAEPTAEPVPTAEPTAEPVPTAEPTAEPTPEPVYTITWISEGNTIKTDKVKYGDEIIAPVNPIKEADADYTYTFKEWEPEVAETVTGDATYTAVYTATAIPYVAAIDDVRYTSLAEAVEAAEAGATITLIDDVELTESLVIAKGKDVTIDLAGKTISQKQNQVGAYAMIDNKGILTIKDSDGEGLISYQDTATGGEYASNTIRNDGVLNVEGGTIESISSTCSDAGYPHAIDVYTGSVTNITGGRIVSEDYDAIRMFCNSDSNPTIVNISGGTIVNRVTFQNPFSNDKPANGVLNITGGEFISTTGKVNVRLLAFGKNYTNMNASISGGTFDKGVGVSNYSNTTIEWKPVTGGTFAVDPSAYVAEGYAAVQQADGTYAIEETYTITFIANGEVVSEKEYLLGATVEAPAVEGYEDDFYTYTFEKWDNEVTAVTGDATYTAVYTATAKYYEASIGDVRYASLAEAFAEANDGDTIVLATDMALDATVVNKNTVTFDLNGHTITGTDNKVAGEGNFYLIDNQKGDLTITDSVGGGKITLVATTDRVWQNSSVVVANNLGTVTLKAGTIEHLGGTSMAYGIDNLTNGKNTVATLNIEGGKVDSAYFAIRQFANNGTNNLNISGGEVTYAWMQSPNNNVNVANINVTGGTVTGICLTGQNADVTMNVAANTTGEVYGTAPSGMLIVGSPEEGFGLEKAVYTITWIVDGVTTTDTVEHGTVPAFAGLTEKAGDAQYSYTFTGWDSEPVAATGDATYTAQFEQTVNKYTVTWKNFDGEVLATEEYEYGQTPEYTGETPEFEGSTFLGWDAEIVAVTGDATYTAQFDYTGIYKTEEGTMYYYVNGEMQKNSGLVKVGGKLYYVHYSGKLVAGGNQTVSEAKANDLAPAGTYYFREDGTMQYQADKFAGEIRNIEGTLWYYVDGEVCPNVGLVKLADGNYYYVHYSGKVVVSGNQTVSETKANTDKTGMAAGTYYFMSNGALKTEKIRLTGGTIVEGYYQIDGQVEKNVGLVKLDNKLYYVHYSGKVVMGSNQTVSESKTNGFAEAGTYYFMKDGSMLTETRKLTGGELVEVDGADYYYVGGELTKNVGLVKIGEDLYYVHYSGKVVKAAYQTVSASKTNGFAEAGTYFFDADGAMVK